MAAHTMADLRAYVTGPGNCGLAKVASTVVLNVEHASLRARFPELRLDLHVRARGGRDGRRRVEGEGGGWGAWGGEGEHPRPPAPLTLQRSKARTPPSSTRSHRAAAPTKPPAPTHPTRHTHPPTHPP